MSQRPPTDTADAKILIAEDHADSREALRTLLEAYGYRVELAANGQEAVARAIEVEPDLVLMDIMMPLMDGFEATRLLRRSAEFRQVPILAITAMEGAQALVADAGCSDYIPKPIDVRKLLEKIRVWLGSANEAVGHRDG